MLVKANCDQLSDGDLFLNIINQESESLGVWSNVYHCECALYKLENAVFFVLFNDKKSKLEYEKKYKYPIIWEKE